LSKYQVYIDQSGNVYIDQSGNVYIDQSGNVYIDQSGNVYIDQSGKKKLVYKVIHYQEMYYQDIYRLYDEDIIFLKENYFGILLYIFFSKNQSEKIIFQLEISVFVAKSIDFSGFGLIFIGKIGKFKSFIQEIGFGDGSLAGRIQFGKYAAVFAQNIIDVAHKLVLIRILFIGK
jgi:hypothetical protein